MLAWMEQVKCKSTAHESRAPHDLEKQIKVCFKKVNDTETDDIRDSGIVFEHHIYRIMPSGEGDIRVQRNLKKFGKTLEKFVVRDHSLVLAQMTSRGRGSSCLFPQPESSRDIVGVEDSGKWWSSLDGVGNRKRGKESSKVRFVSVPCR